MDTIKLTLVLLVMIVIPYDGKCQTGIQFSPSSTNTISEIPGTIDTGDFNGDGNPDFITANNSTVTVGLGDGNGGFVSLRNYTIQGSLRQVHTADLNRDGLTDACVTFGYEFGYIAVLMATNGGTLYLHTTVRDSRYCNSLDFGDFDGDTNLDFIVEGHAGNFVTIHFGNGHGEFPTSTNLNIPDLPDCVAASDLNRDGRPDVLVGSKSVHSPSLVILLNQPDRSFITATNVSLLSNDDPEVRAITVADFTGNGWLDIAVSFENDSALSVVLQQEGIFTVGNNYILRTEANSCVTADFNGDGVPDLATESDLLLGKGNGEFLFPGNGEFVSPHEEDDFPNSVAVADISRDGRPDILWAFHRVICSTNNTSPSLQIVKTNSQVRISWPMWNTFSLQVATDLNGTSDWNNVTNGVLQFDRRNALLERVQSPAQYFRLRSN